MVDTDELVLHAIALNHGYGINAKQIADGLDAAAHEVVELRVDRDALAARLEALEAAVRRVISDETDDDNGMNCMVCDAFHASNAQCLPWCCIGKLKAALEAAGEE